VFFDPCVVCFFFSFCARKGQQEWRSSKANSPLAGASDLLISWCKPLLCLGLSSGYRLLYIHFSTVLPPPVDVKCSGLEHAEPLEVLSCLKHILVPPPPLIAFPFGYFSQCAPPPRPLQTVFLDCLCSYDVRYSSRFLRFSSPASTRLMASHAERDGQHLHNTHTSELFKHSTWFWFGV